MEKWENNMAEIHRHFEYKCLQLTYITLTGRRCILWKILKE